MILEYIAIGIIIISIGIIIYIAFKKFPVISSINLNAIQKHQQDQVKKGLLEERLVRKFKSFNIKSLVGSSHDNGKETNANHDSNWFNRTYDRLRSLEKRYKDRIKIQLPQDKAEQEKNKTILLNEANELAEKEEYKLAEEKYIELISLDKKFNEAYEGLADVYFEMKDYEHAKEIYEYLLKTNSQDDSSIGQLGKIAAKEEKLDQTKEEYIKPISLNNTVASYHVDLGDVYMATSEYKKAMQCYQEALKLEPNNPKYLDSLLTVAIKLHDIFIAEEMFGKLKEANPENEKLEEIKEQIKEIKNK